MVMFSCTADAADAAETYLDEARAKRRVVDIQDIVNAVDAWLLSMTETEASRLSDHLQHDHPAESIGRPPGQADD